MPPNTNPFLVAVYVAGVVILVPTIKVLWSGAVFFAKAVTKLDLIDGIAEDVAHMKEERTENRYSLEMDLYCIETDINALQKKAGVDVRQYPDRRVSGIADRRSA